MPRQSLWKSWSPRLLSKLGKMPDGVVAKLAGCSLSAVAQNRRALNIPAFVSARQKPKGHSWQALLGQATDADIARFYRLSRARVHQVRTRLGIPAWKP